MFSSDKIGSQFNLIVDESDFTNIRQT
jgi:hypothetical protein